jgi:hypothetical protein
MFERPFILVKNNELSHLFNALCPDDILSLSREIPLSNYDVILLKGDVMRHKS